MLEDASDEILVFGGSASPRLTRAVCDHLGVAVGRGEVLRFSEGNLFVRVLQNVRGRSVYILQSTVFPSNDHFMELLFWIDALKRASAASVTAVIPYFSYAKGDKKDEPRVSIRARVCADCLEAAGADRIVTLDLHAAQIQGFFRVPVDDLYAMRILCDAVQGEAVGDLVVVAPDAGFAKKALRYASHLRAPIAIGDKRRVDHDERAEVVEISGDVRGRTALIVDDFTISGTSLIETAEMALRRGATGAIAAVTHGVFSPGSMARIDQSPIARLYVTDSVETSPEQPSARVHTVSIAPLISEAIKRIHNRESISGLFNS